MTFRKGHKKLKKGDRYHEDTGVLKEKPPSPPPTVDSDALYSPPSKISPKNFSQKNSSKNISQNISANPVAKPGQIIWAPHPGPQTRFHTSGAYEMLFGGTKGPGKTETLLREGLRQVHIPNYRAIIFRRTYPNLREIIDSSNKYFGGLGAKFNAQDHRWIFPSGATYAFGHVKHEHDKYNHNGHEYHYIGFDKVTEFTETQ